MPGSQIWTKCKGSVGKLNAILFSFFLNQFVYILDGIKAANIMGEIVT